MSSFYFIGYLSAIAFTLRFLVQWIESEKEGRSVVPKAFWWLSITGNVTLFIHSLIQMQFPMSFIQGINGVISWRNLNLMGNRKASFAIVALLFLSVSAFCVSYFFLRANGIEEWFSIPTHTFQPDPNRSAPLVLHLFGLIGVFLFNSRFIIQWWQSEKSGVSVLSPLFWWTSLIGGLFSLIYFVSIMDFVNLIGPLFGIVPYARNLILLRRQTA